MYVKYKPDKEGLAVAQGKKSLLIFFKITKLLNPVTPYRHCEPLKRNSGFCPLTVNVQL